MKNAIFVVVCTWLLVGCADSVRPLASGTPVSGKVWKESRRANVGENSAKPIPSDSKVDVYQELIIIRHNDGSRQVVPMD
ncbi:MAG: hypothetical protein ACK4UN_08500, partial [Limisphaerales bacterium]